MPIPVTVGGAMSWLRALFGYQVVTQAGIPVPQRPILEIPNGSLADDPANNRTVYTPPGATVIGVYPAQPNTLPLRGSASEGLFGFVGLTATGVAGSGFVRLTSAAQTAIAAVSIGGRYDIPLIGVNGADGVLVGDPANTVSVSLQIASGAEIQLGAFGTSIYDPTSSGVNIGGQALNLNSTRTYVGAGATWGQFIRNPRAFGLNTAPAFSINWDSFGTHTDFTLTVNATLSACTNVVAGGRYTITVRQGAGGPYTITWDASFKFGSTFSGTLTAVAGAVDIFEFIGDTGNVMRCVGASKGVQ